MWDPCGRALQFVPLAAPVVILTLNAAVTSPEEVVLEQTFFSPSHIRITRQTEHVRKPFYTGCASTGRRAGLGCGSLWLPDRELPQFKGDMIYLYFDHWHRGGRSRRTVGSEQWVVRRTTTGQHGGGSLWSGRVFELSCTFENHAAAPKATHWSYDNTFVCRMICQNWGKSYLDTFLWTVIIWK